MRVCDWIAEYLYDMGVAQVHGLMGGGASGLNDGFIKNGKIKYICYHHEQGAGHAAIGESKFTGKLAVVNPTTGCGGTNCATSVLNAWQDSVPILFLSGNVRLNTCSSWINERKNVNIRKYGIQEHNIIDTVRSMTKYSEFVTHVDQVAHCIQMAVFLAKNGRPGPVWVDIPGDIQTAQMPEIYRKLVVVGSQFSEYSVNMYNRIKEKIEAAERPLVLAGYGIRQSGSAELFAEFIEKYELPFVYTYGGSDYLPADHSLSIGAVGIKGSRAGNFALQQAGFLLILGSSLGASVIGYDPYQFSPHSYKMAIDIDQSELNKDIIKIDEKINDFLPDFFRGMNE